MILKIALKDFYNNLVSSRFVIGFLLCLFLIPFTMIVSINDYQSQMKAYETEFKQAEENNHIRVYSEYRPEIVKAPEPLSIFSRGISHQVGNKVRILFGEKPMTATGKTAVRDNPLLNSFFSLDFTSVLAIIMSLLALLFSYDACTGEREQGTLKLLMVSSLGSWKILLGKIVGAVLTLLPVILFCYIICSLIILFHPAVAFSTAEWLSIVALFGISIVYFVFFLAVGLLISTRLRSSVTSIIVCLFIWVSTVFVIPNMAVYGAQSFVQRDTEENLRFALSDLDQKFRSEEDAYANTLPAPDWWMHFNLSGRIDGGALMGGCAKSLYERYRDLNTFREPLRVEYADKKWALQKAYIDKLDKQRKFAERLALSSPSELYRQAVSSLCKTDVPAQYRFLEKTREYREELIGYYQDEGLFESFNYFTREDPKTFMTADEIIITRTGGDFKTLADYNTNGGTWKSMDKVDIPGTNPYEYDFLDTSNMPQFHTSAGIDAKAVISVLYRAAVLLIVSILLFFLSFVSFTRYDVR